MISSAEPFFSSRASIARSISVIDTYAIADDRQPDASGRRSPGRVDLDVESIPWGPLSLSASIPSATSRSTRSPASSRTRASCARSSSRRCSPTRSAWTRSASASTTAPTSPSPRRRSSWPRSPRAPAESGSARPSPCSAPTIRCGCSSASRRVDALSNGRAEVILGRGSFTESYPLFGFDLTRYDELFEDRLGAVRRDPEGWPGDVERHDALTDHGHRDPSADRIGPADDLDRRRRQPRLGAARRPPRPAADAGDHRRRSAAVPAVRRSLPARARAARPADRCRSPRTRPGTSPPPTIRRATSCGRTTRR